MANERWLIHRHGAGYRGRDGSSGSRTRSKNATNGTGLCGAYGSFGGRRRESVKGRQNTQNL